MRMKRIPLTQGQFAIIDADDYNRLSRFRWHVQKTPYTYYAGRWVMIKGLYSTHPRQLGRYRKIKVTMARQIMGLCNEDATVVDHINHNGLDNRKSNLRVCTVQQNTQNKNKDRGCTSSYKGVSKRSRGSRWVVMVRNKHVGYFDTELLAAKAYDEEAKKQYGEYACLNFPNEIAV